MATEGATKSAQFFQNAFRLGGQFTKAVQQFSSAISDFEAEINQFIDGDMTRFVSKIKEPAQTISITSKELKNKELVGYMDSFVKNVQSTIKIVDKLKNVMADAVNTLKDKRAVASNLSESVFTKMKEIQSAAVSDIEKAVLKIYLQELV